MEAKELRLRNYIYYKNVVHKVDCSDITNLQNFCEPIKLDEKWLRKFKFYKKEEDRMVWLKDMPDYEATLQMWNGNDYMSICRSGIAAYHFECKYVHQLQNLYYALTGKELI